MAVGLGVYTKRFNIRHKLCGHLFAGRYKALIVDLRQETTMSLHWIAQRLQMGSWTYVFNLLHEKSQTEDLCK